jgi:hypothetical protein
MISNTWSKLNSDALKLLSPNLGIRSWDEVSLQQKEIMWQNFISEDWFGQNLETYQAVSQFNEKYKAGDFCSHLQKHRQMAHKGSKIKERPLGTFGQFVPNCCEEAAQKDFEHIFCSQKQDVVYELISLYVLVLEHTFSARDETAFKNYFNDISNQFGLNVLFNPKFQDKIKK